MKFSDGGTRNTKTRDVVNDRASVFLEITAEILRPLYPGVMKWNINKYWGVFYDISISFLLRLKLLKFSYLINDISLVFGSLYENSEQCRKELRHRSSHQICSIKRTVLKNLANGCFWNQGQKNPSPYYKAVKILITISSLHLRLLVKSITLGNSHFLHFLLTQPFWDIGLLGIFNHEYTLPNSDFGDFEEQFKRKTCNKPKLRIYKEGIKTRLFLY